MGDEKKAKAMRGWAAMTPEQRREAASRGGKTAQAKGTAHRWTKEEASAAGRKGGLAKAASRVHAASEAAAEAAAESSAGPASAA